MGFENYFRSLKRWIYLETVLGILVFVFLLSSILYFPQGTLLYIAVTVVLVALAVTLIMKTRRMVSESGLTDIPDDERFEKLFDKYARRLINWILITFLYVFGFLMTSVSLGINSKSSELLETFNHNLLALEIVAFFLIKNLLITKWLLSVHEYSKKPELCKTIKRIIIGSAVYWAAATGIFFAFEYVFVLNIYTFLTGVFTVCIIVLNLTVIRKLLYNRKKYGLIVLAVVLVIAVVAGGYTFLSRDIWLTQPYINSIPNIYDGKSDISYDDETGIYTITKPAGDFKILQLTDIHLGGGVLSYDKDVKALEAVYELLDRTRPDLVIVTGDLVFPVGYASFSFNNTAPVQQFAAFMRNLGIPWAFTYGNHDTESYAATSTGDLNELYKKLSWKTSKTLLYPYVQPYVTGRSNQLIELRNADGTLREALFLIDSNAYTGDGLNKYDYIHDDQVDWYKAQVLREENEEGHIVPSMVFFHIPLQEYKEAYKLYESGSDEVKYFFGSNDEEMMDKVCCSEYPSKLFDTARELGSTTGFFCGHDHYNNMSLEYKGMRLTYGMSIDYLAMPGIARDTKQRGATLITVHDDGSEDI
ncbi:MAG: metallophosphoesterase family protein, partial [Lachnospiraceae bacterium]|nr:metallophosphoesterase family protein [Lachnospiraceae bacterium]